MAFHIVTNKCFLACEKITSVVIEELILDAPPKPRRQKRRNKKGKLIRGLFKKTPQKVLQQFLISIAYYPLSTLTGNSGGNSGGFGSSNNKEESILELRILGKKEANMLYAEIIREVQEQHPNEGYLDKLVTKMLEGKDFQIEEPEMIDVI